MCTRGGAKALLGELSWMRKGIWSSLLEKLGPWPWFFGKINVGIWRLNRKRKRSLWPVWKSVIVGTWSTRSSSHLLWFPCASGTPPWGHNQLEWPRSPKPTYSPSPSPLFFLKTTGMNSCTSRLILLSELTLTRLMLLRGGRAWFDFARAQLGLYFAIFCFFLWQLDMWICRI